MADTEPMCGCMGCELVSMGKQMHGHIAELRNMIDSRDRRLNEIYNVAANQTESIAKDIPSEYEGQIPNRYPGGKY